MGRRMPPIANAVDLPADGVVERRTAAAIADQRDIDIRRLHKRLADQEVGRTNACMTEGHLAGIFLAKSRNSAKFFAGKSFFNAITGVVLATIPTGAKSSGVNLRSG